ncbi:hypothetical protein BKA65DRAFT_507859 [Rhexocercosporidium sp. MPI-PUGE-AT-0058]|nr:hypothetical protein BKA65DRAFT_507859 [Rhexocercosporidium sp. MPI-PUGE-AT-0058]
MPSSSSTPQTQPGSKSQSNATPLRYDKTILVIGSLASYGSLPGSPEYTSMKWGTRGLFRSLRFELLKTGIRVHMLAPTFVETPMTREIVPQLKKAGARFACVESVASVVGRLVGEEGREWNGEFVSCALLMDLFWDVVSLRGFC